jgi:hypothetical protein
MSWRLQQVEDTSADKLTETDHVITSLPTVKKIMPVWQAKIFFVAGRRNGITENVTTNEYDKDK